MSSLDQIKKRWSEWGREEATVGNGAKTNKDKTSE
jgi:hypothetical protein